MPWQETRVMDSRIMFIGEVLKDEYSMSELCEQFGISRKTGYKWLDRYTSGGPAGLGDISRAPLSHPQAIGDDMEEAILAVKRRFPHWGPVKIAHRLHKEHSGWERYPAVSTIGLLLKREGLVCTRRRHGHASPTIPPLTDGQNANDVWCADFKGHFPTGDGQKCYPLTITDHFTRYLLCCRHLDRMRYEPVRMQFERAFREYGLPCVIRTDNGAPFSSHGLGGLSKLSAWWIRLGVHPERIAPGKPCQNGRHERMHRTLKEHTACPPARDVHLQQKRFNEFIREYNQQRPHEAIGMQTPEAVYRRSWRKLPSRIPAVEYCKDMAVRKVETHGDIWYQTKRLFVTESLAGEYIGLEPIAEDKSRLWYCDYELGVLNHREWRIEQVYRHPLLAGASPCTAHNSRKVLPMSSV
jgi:transposase InsO family protein